MGALGSVLPVPAQHAVYSSCPPIGPRIAAPCWQDVFPTRISGAALPWEDRKLKEATAEQARARRPGQGLVCFVLDATREGASQCVFCGFVLRTAPRRPIPVGAMRPRDGRNF